MTIDRAIGLLKMAVPMRAVTMSEFNDFIEAVNMAIDALENLPSAEPEVIHCKDCRNRGEDECPMRHVERIEWEEDGYIEVDDVTHDWTTDEGFCHCADMRGEQE